MATLPSLDAVRAQLRDHDAVPLCREITSDLETPVSAYLKIAAVGGPSFLLESVERGEALGRWSLIGAAPRSLLRWQDGGPAGTTLPDDVRSARDPWEAVARLCPQLKVAPLPLRDPPPMVGGAVGYWGYETVRYLEPRVPAAADDDQHLPEAAFMVPRGLVVFDHVKHRLLIIAVVFADEALDEAYAAAIRLLDDWAQRLREPLSARPLELDRGDAQLGPEVAYTTNVEAEAFRAAVRQGQEHIKAGDIFQVVLSQRLTTRTEASPFDLYRTLRVLNPSPYMFFLDWGDFQLVGSSPEVMVRVDGQQAGAADRVAHLRPIAGTRRRAADEAGDRLLEAELLADEKERAEHVMLVDLGRNDLGRVCRVGSVHVSDFMVVERYSHVMHIVSHVRGVLPEGTSGLDVLRAAFPAGTLSGAPKVRAMQIIAGLEPTWRGPYGGAVGYLGLDGALNTGITIRTMVVRGSTVTVQAGAGVVADSDPEAERQECLNKAQALLQTLRLAPTPTPSR